MKLFSRKISKDSINLLPQVERKTGRAMSMGALFILLFSLAWIGVLAWQTATIWSLKKKTASLISSGQARQQELAALQHALGVTTAEGTNPDNAELINNLLVERVLWSEVFKQFSHVVPKGLWFDNLEGTGGDRREIRIRGGAFSYLSVSDFMVAMEKSGYFISPQLSYARKAVVQGQDVIGFEIICGIKKNQGSR